MKIKNSSIVKFILFAEIFISTVSPKAFKILTGYQGVYPNPNLIILPMLIFLLYNLGAFNKYTIFKNYKQLFLILLSLSALYFISSFFAILLIDLDNSYNPILQSLRMTFVYVFLVPLFLLLKEEYVWFSIKSLIFIAIIHFLFFLHGLLAFFNVFPISDEFLEIVKKDILGQSWTMIGFIPKWRGLFEETQLFATFNFISSFLSFQLYKKYGYKLYFMLSILFFLFSVYLFSKGTILSILIFFGFIFFKKFRIKPLLFRYIITFTIFISIGFTFFHTAISLEKEQFSNIYEAGVESAASFGERIYHVVKTLEINTEKVYSIFIGIGPRTYGSILYKEFPWRFNPDSNAISFFTVFQDIGIVGFILTLIVIFLLINNSKIMKIRVFFISILIGYSLQMSWGHPIMLIIFVLLSKLGRLVNEKALY